MTPTDDLVRDIADFALTGAGVGVVVFTLCYMIFFRWHKTPSGIAILLLTTSLSLLLLLGIVSRATDGDYFLRDWFRLGAALLCLVAPWGLVAVLLHGWLRGRKPLNLVERDSFKRTPSGGIPLDREYDPDADTIPDARSRQ